MSAHRITPESIPSAREAPGGTETGPKHRKNSGDRFWPHLNRRQFLRATAVTGMGVGMATIGLLPPARRAIASHQNEYKLFDDGPNNLCPNSIDWYDNHGGNCDAPCGPSTIYPHACNESDPRKHWHKDHSSNGDWALRPNVCASDGSDAWIWKVDRACGGCGNNTKFRCHDGYKDYQQAGQDNSICKAIVECNSAGSN
jgi:hypothetical protein